MIISFDPGGNTGIVLASNINFKTREFDIAGKQVLAFAQREKIMDILLRYAPKLQAIVIEDFLLFPDKAAEQAYSRFEPVKVIERITVYAEQLGLAHLIAIQAPGLRKSAKLPAGAHRLALGHNRHLDAAYQHLRYYIFMHKHSGNEPVTPNT